MKFVELHNEGDLIYINLERVEAVFEDDGKVFFSYGRNENGRTDKVRIDEPLEKVLPLIGIKKQSK